MKTDLKINPYVSMTGRPRKPKLSILMPYYHDDPVPLLLALSEQCEGRRDVELLAYDDGSSDPDLNRRAIAAIKDSRTPIGLFIAEQNRGRSFARNQLFSRARGNWVLFLDADMRPERSSFVDNYVQLISEMECDIIFGGFKVEEKSLDPDRELHRALSEISDCLSLQERQAAGPQFVCSSNLAVRKTVLEAEPFDPEFSGWGWEDSEWAARVFKSFKLMHADIPAVHLGLETTDTLLKRFQSSGSNYQRFTHKHPDLAENLPLYRIIQKIKKIPGQQLARPLLRMIVRLNLAPIRLRLLALKLWRASWYAEMFA